MPRALGRDRSLADPAQARIDAEHAEHRLAGDRPLAEQHLAPGSRRQIDVDPAAEADQADALAGARPVALAHEGQDAPRDQPGDLGEADRDPVLALDQEMLALIVLARLVEVGVEELARHIGDAATRPAIGERLMWTSNTLMKIDTRVNSPVEAAVRGQLRRRAGAG